MNDFLCVVEMGRREREVSGYLCKEKGRGGRREGGRKEGCEGEGVRGRGRKGGREGREKGGMKRESGRGTHNARMTRAMRSKSAARAANPNRTPSPASWAVSSPAHYRVMFNSVYQVRANIMSMADS